MKILKITTEGNSVVFVKLDFSREFFERSYWKIAFTEEVDGCGYNTGCGWNSFLCGNPLPCKDHSDARCGCGKPATTGCSSAGQFVCGRPVCDNHSYCQRCGGWNNDDYVIKLEAEVQRLKGLLEGDADGR